MKEAQLTDILLELSENAGVAGDEEGVVGLAARYFRQYTDRVETDRFGNLIAFKRGEKNGTGEQVSLAVLTHIDEIGAMVTKIEAEGFLRFTSVGGIDPRTLLGQAVVVHGRTPLTGVIGALAPHLLSEKERKKELKMEHLFIDLGLTREQMQANPRQVDASALSQDTRKTIAQNQFGMVLFTQG